MLKCYIEGRNKINGTHEQYKIANGAVFVENGNETLDSGTIILPQLSHKIQIEPYDIVVIWSDEDSKYKINSRRMCVDTVTCIQTSLRPAIYKYEISLFSETKLLEGIACPSLSITKTPTDRTVYQYLVQYLNEYGTKTAVNPANMYATNKFSFSSRVNTKFSSIICPELQWNEPTLREVFTDLMMVADCIPVVKNNVIDYMDISSEGEEISENQRKSINYIQESQSSQDYISELKMNVRNALNNNKPSGSITSYNDEDIPKDASCIVEEIGFRNYETYQLTTERLKLETQMPIWNLFYVGFMVRTWGSVSYKRDESGQEIIKNGNFNNGTNDWILTGSDNTMSVSNGQMIISVGSSGSGGLKQNIVMTDDIKSSSFHYKIVAKSSTVGTIFAAFHEKDTGQSSVVRLDLGTNFETFEGDITVSYDGGEYKLDYLYIDLLSSFKNEQIIFKSISLTGTKVITRTYTIAQNDLLKAEKNITDYILEYGLWQTKDIYYAGANSTQGFSTNWQNTCLYFKRGQKGIFNFSAVQTWKFLWITSQTMVYELMKADMGTIAENAMIEKCKMVYPESDGYYGYSVISRTTPAITDDNVGACRFRIKYEPIDDCVFKASKSPMVRNQRVVIDNQTNSYVDINRAGMLEYLKANRLGNKMKIINGRYLCDENDMPQLFQKIDGSIIFRKEIAIHGNYIKVNYQATENYVLKDYFTSVKSRLRSWRIVDGAEAFTRADVFKFFVGRNIPSVNNENVKIPSYQTAEEYLNNFNYCVLQFTTESEGMKPSNPEYNFYFLVVSQPINATTYRSQNAFMQEFSKHRCGKSVLFTFKLYDNTLVGKYIYNNYEFKENLLTWTATLLGFSPTIGNQQRNARYTDINGEITGGIIRFFKKPNALDYLSSYDAAFSPSIKPYCNFGGDHTGIFQYNGNFMPNEDMVFQMPFTLHKDNKEIPQITIQFEINDEADDMFLGKKNND